MTRATHLSAPPAEASIADVARAVRRRWVWVAGPTLVALVASLIFVLVVPARYTGEARLLLQAGESYFTRPGGERAEQTPQIDEQAVASQVQVVMSRDLARKAIDRLKLVGNPEFDPDADGVGLFQRLGVMVGLVRDPSTRPPEERVLEQFYDRLLVYPVGKSRIVAIEFRSKDADLAARGANTVAELYLEIQEDAKKDQARSASTWLGTNIEGLRKRVADAEAKVETFRAKTGLLSGTGTTTLSAQQLSELSSQLGQARTQQSDSESKAKLIRDLIKEGRAFDIPDVANNELIRRLMEQRVNLKAQLALELRTLLPQHPRIKELDAQLSDLESQIRSAADRTVRTLENDAKIAGGRVDSLVAAVDVQKKIVEKANEGEVQLRALEREARIQREQLESYLGRYREASARDADYGMPPDARIVSRAVVPQIPSFPKKLPIVGLSTLAALFLSVGAIVARELLATEAARRGGPVTYELPEEDEEERAQPGKPGGAVVADPFAFDLTHLHEAPRRLGAVSREAQMGDLIEPDRHETIKAGPPPAAPQPERRIDYDGLIARLSRHETDRAGRVVLVSPVETRDGGHAVAHGLALALAEEHRTLLIVVDGDEDSAVEELPGLTDLLAGEAKFGEVIRTEPETPLHIVGPGTLVNEAITSNPDGCDVALAAFAEVYDWVICTLVGDEIDLLRETFAPFVDTVVLASSLAPSDPELVRAYDAARRAGASDLVVARDEARGFEKAA